MKMTTISDGAASISRSAQRFFADVNKKDQEFFTKVEDGRRFEVEVDKVAESGVHSDSVKWFEGRRFSAMRAAFTAYTACDSHPHGPRLNRHGLGESSISNCVVMIALLRRPISMFTAGILRIDIAAPSFRRCLPFLGRVESQSLVVRPENPHHEWLAPAWRLSVDQISSAEAGYAGKSKQIRCKGRMLVTA